MGDRWNGSGGVCPAWRARNLGEAESHGGIWLGVWLNPNVRVRDPWSEQSPEATMLLFSNIGMQSREGHGV